MLINRIFHYDMLINGIYFQMTKYLAKVQIFSICLFKKTFCIFKKGINLRILASYQQIYEENINTTVT